MFHIVSITDGLVSLLSHSRIVRITEELDPVTPHTYVSHSADYGRAGQPIIPLTYSKHYGWFSSLSLSFFLSGL